MSWSFTATNAPWANGVAERSVGLIKKHLAPLIAAQNLSIMEFSTALCVATNVLNSRPIGSFSKSAGCAVPLSPACFLNAAATPQPPPELRVDEALGKRAACLAAIFSKLTRRLASEVLDLRGSSSKWKSDCGKQVTVGVLAAFYDQSLGSSSTYRLGTVCEVKTGADGVVRSARISYKVGNVHHTTTRSVRTLVIL